MNVNGQNESSFGFITANGKKINVSNKALAKANELFTKASKETETHEETFKKRTNESNGQVPKAESQKIHDLQVSATSDVSFKMKDLSEKTAVNSENVASLPGFQTARGRSIKVSDEALSRAQKQFEDDLQEKINKTSTVTINNRSEDVRNQNNALAKRALHRREIFSRETLKNAKSTFSSEFKTAGSKSLKISDNSLSKVMQLFKDELEEETNQPGTSKINNKFETVDSRRFVSVNKTGKTESFSEKSMCRIKNVTRSVGFKTANGNSINVSEKALSNAEHLFINDLEDTEEFKEISRSTNKREIQVAHSDEALLKGKALHCQETSEDCEGNFLLSKSLPKRKVKDLYDDVTSSKHATCNQVKKLRISSEFEIPKSCRRDLKDTQGKKDETVPSMKTEVSLNNDISKLGNSISKAATSKKDIDIDNLISHEIVESTVALLADETDLNTAEQWVSPVAMKENEEVADLPSSPVIGQFIPKKRKNINNRKKSVNTLTNVEIKSVNAPNLKELNDIDSDKCIKKQNEDLVEKEEYASKETKSEISMSNEFSDTQLMMDFVNEFANILEKRLEASLEQDKQISLKKKNRPIPTISKLYFHRRTNRDKRISWKQVSKGYPPTLCRYEELIERKLPPEILHVTVDNAITYKFRCTDFYGQDVLQNNIEGIELEDKGRLILDENGYVGISEIKRSFLASPGVDPNLLPAGWVENHYKFIVWKLASMDRVKFGPVTLSRILTPARVLLELKYRYDREIDRSERPALRKILEKDDAASKRMVLCISSIFEHDDSATINRSPNKFNPPSKRLILTDGWYSVQASIDHAMMKHVISGKVKEGTKLIMYGSELLNCDQGCSPLEVLGNVCLKIHTNSTRRVKWDTKLGYVAPRGPMCVKLGSICTNGGLIGKIKVFIARVYPILYYEKIPDGESIYRNARCEEKANTNYEEERQSIIETFHAEAEKYFSTETRKSTSNPDSIDLAAIEWNEDREKLSREEFLSKQEQEQLINDCHMKHEKFRQKLESRLQKSLPPPRQVTPVLKVRVVEGETNAILSVWSPGEEVTDILKEGNFISVCNVMPTGRRGNEIQLTTSRNTVFRRLKIPNTIYPLRTYTALCSVNKPTFAPTHGEFDTVGLVVSIGNEPCGMKNFQAAYLAYPHINSESSYLSVLFWHGLSSHGYAEILTVGSAVACSNLEWRKATPWNVPMAYCTERSTFTQNPRQKHLQQPFEALDRLVTDIDSYVTTCAAEISEKIQKKSTTRMSDQYTPNKTLANERFNSDKSIDNSTPQEILARNSTSNHETARSIALRKRLEKLQYYGEPSSLSPIVLNNSSKRVLLDFQSPVRSSNTQNTQQTKVNVSLSEKF